jgi:hypothetical protein
VTLNWQRDQINPNLSVGVDTTSVAPLKSNRGLSAMGIILGGSGFFLDPDGAEGVLESALNAGVASRYLSGMDLAKSQRGKFVVDFSGMTEDEARDKCPAAYQWVLERVKPTRTQNRMSRRAQKWWIYASDAPEMRNSISGLHRFIATHRTAKHRCFSFVQGGTLPESNVVTIAGDDAWMLGILSSHIHVRWAARAGGKLEDRPHYTNSTIFNPFPFPEPSTDAAITACIRNVAERLDAHRRRQQAAHPELTLTGMYNVLKKLRAGESLTAKERTIHEQGLISVLRQLHGELDEAVLSAYGWGDLLPLLRIAHGNEAPATGQARDEAKHACDKAILERLVALNAQRAANEAKGVVIWLRPEFQNPQAERAPEQRGLDATVLEVEGDESAELVVTAKPSPWPKDAVDQVRVVADLLAASPVPLSIDEIAGRFTARGPWKRRLPRIVEMLVALGSAREQGEGSYVGSA